MPPIGCMLQFMEVTRSQLKAGYVSGTTSVASGATVYDTITLYGRGVDSLFCSFQAIGAFSYEFKYEIIDTSTNDTEPNDSFSFAATLINQNENKAAISNIF